MLMQFDKVMVLEKLHPHFKRKHLVIFALNIIMLIVLSRSLSYQMQLQHFNMTNAKKDQMLNNQTLSPFRNTLGFIRWNSAHRERIPTMEKYRPFFADLHYSMPDYSPNFTLTADGWKDSHTEYKALADTMHIILQNYSTIEGLLYFHFDAWINPFKFDDLNFRQIWFPDAPLPPFRCVDSTAGWSWWAWNDQYHMIAKNATQKVISKYANRFVANASIFCGGWSDIYYIPRHFFKDFIDLSNVFYEFKSFHEVAIPTMVNIIDLTHRKTPFHTIITRLYDCWGDCCAGGSQPADIKRKRCGHRMDLSNNAITQTLIGILESEAAYLNKNRTRL